jgi:transcriptional regulator with XRE-family HTH domain
MGKDIYEVLAKRIREARKRSGLTLERLAEAAGIGASFLAYIETGGRKPSLATIDKIAGALRIPVAELFKDAPPHPPKDDYQFAQQVSSLVRDTTPSQKATVLNTIKALAKSLRNP